MRHKGREVVYVERGDSSAKWLFWGALLGAGLALMYAPQQRGGDPPRSAAPAVEAAGDDRGEARRAGPAVRRAAASRCATLDEEDLDEEELLRVAGCSVGPGASGAVGPGGAGAAAGRGPRPPPRPRETSRSRSPERDPTRRVVSVARRLHPPHPAGRRRIQPPVPRERAHLRRAARGHSVRPAAADRPHSPGPGAAGQHPGGRVAAVPPLLPAAHLHARTATRSASIETLLVRISREPGHRSRSTPSRRSSGSAPGSSPASAPRSTRSTTSPPGPARTGISCSTLLYAKLRDIGMVVATVMLFLANTCSRPGSR